jgi:GNAT superfamily N-acetyltransferase
MTDLVKWRHNPFDSQAVGMSMITITGLGTSHSLREPLQAWVNSRCDEGWNHAHCRVQVGDFQAKRALEDVGFRCVDSLATLSFAGQATVNPDDRVQPYRPIDEASIQALSQGSFSLTRYARDPHMPPGAADRVVESWIGNNLNGRAHNTWVIREQGQAVAFLSSLWDSSKRWASVDLIAVEKQQRGTGLGRALIEAMVSHYSSTATEISIGTQGDNLAALALYQSCGFRVRRLELGFARLLSATAAINGLPPGIEPPALS